MIINGNVRKEAREFAERNARAANKCGRYLSSHKQVALMQTLCTNTNHANKTTSPRDLAMRLYASCVRNGPKDGICKGCVREEGRGRL